MKTPTLALLMSFIPALASANPTTVATCRMKFTDATPDQVLKFNMVRKKSPEPDMYEYLVRVKVNLKGSTRTLDWSLGFFEEAPKAEELRLAIFRNGTGNVEMAIAPLESKSEDFKVYEFFSGVLNPTDSSVALNQGVLFCKK
jgi:hypothetical protein